MHKFLALLCLGGAVLLVAGCGGAKTYPVSGTITFNGEPVLTGDILFIPADNSAGPDVGKIEKGEYQLRTGPGKKRVEIRASKLVRQVKGAMGPEYQDYIPPEYNSNSKLGADVAPSGVNRFDFPLKAGKKP